MKKIITAAIDVERISLRGQMKERELKIYYTTDGTAPSLNSKLYSVPFQVSKPTTVKAAVFENRKQLMTFESAFDDSVTNPANISNSDDTASSNDDTMPSNENILSN